jgi:hypothetical protein
MRPPKRAAAASSGRTMPTYENCVAILDGTGTVFEREQHAAALIQAAAEMDCGVAERALLALYSLQTGEEKAFGVSTAHNGKGFDREFGRDASIVAEKLIANRPLTKKQIENMLDIIQRFRVQLITKIDRCELRTIFNGGAGHQHTFFPARKAADEADDEMYDDDDEAFIDDEEEEEDEEDEEYEEEAEEEAMPVRVLTPTDVPAPPLPAVVAPPKRVSKPVTPLNKPVHASLYSTSFGLRGALMFSANTEMLFQRAIRTHDTNAPRIFDFMAGVPGLSLSDVHVRVWQLRNGSEPSDPTGSHVVAFVDGAWRNARVEDTCCGSFKLAFAENEASWIDPSTVMLYFQ